jgi:dephospho-CoA kinase
MHVLGLTGGIASGKSTISGMLRSLGALVIDADAIAREVVMPGTAGFSAVVNAFGPTVVDCAGSLDRHLLADIIFSDSAAKHRLEKIVHPLVHEAIVQRLQEAKAASNVPLVVLDIPLLFESGIALPLCDRTAVVWVPEKIQLARLMKRDNLTCDAALARIKSQLPLDQKRKMADICLDNSGSLQDTANQVQKVWRTLTGSIGDGR